MTFPVASRKASQCLPLKEAEQLDQNKNLAKESIYRLLMAPRTKDRRCCNEVQWHCSDSAHTQGWECAGDSAGTWEKHRKRQDQAERRQQGQQGLGSGEALTWGTSLSDLHMSLWKEEPAPVPNLSALLLLPATGTCVPEIMAQAVLHHLSLLAVVTPISHGVIPKGQPQGPSCHQQWGHPSCCLTPSGFRKPQPCLPHT